MSSRHEDLSQLKDYIKGIDNEVTMILQSLQWDRKHLLQYKPKATCKYNSNHKIPPENLKQHEENCKFKSLGYVKDDVFLPDAFNINSNTYLRLTSEDIREIINYASKTDPMFMKGDAHVRSQNESEPLTLERLQSTYTPDERRAIYDVVINAAPSNQDISDLTLPKSYRDKIELRRMQLCRNVEPYQRADGGPVQSKPKSKQELLAELRDERRRRARYRVPGSSNYSHALRGLIDAQMEMYTEAQNIGKSKLRSDTSEIKFRTDEENRYKHRKSSEDDRRKRDREFAKDRNDYGLKNGKRDYSESSNSQECENGRHHPTEENRQYNERNGKHERQRESHRREGDHRKYDRTKNLERNETYKRHERDRYSSNSRDRYGDGERDGRCRSKSSERYRVEGKGDDEYNQYEKKYSHRHKSDGRYHDKSRAQLRTNMKRENLGFNDEYNKYEKYKEYSHRDKRDHHDY